jgi:hypothetical protein
LRATCVDARGLGDATLLRSTMDELAAVAIETGTVLVL